MMVPFGSQDAAKWCGARVEGAAGSSYSSVSIDSRSLVPGALFVAIRGPHHDGHRFIDQAIAAGARGVMVDSQRGEARRENAHVDALEVEDTTRALGNLAHGHRNQWEGLVVAISGSSGKTTTKDMCASILAQGGPCLKTLGNLNNEFGLPLTLLSREPQHESAVVELGMNHRGEIARLAEIAEPRIGLLTNIGSAHIEFLGSRENIAAEKGDLFASLPESGVAVVNLEDPEVVDQAQRARCGRLGYGCGEEAEVRAANVRFDPLPRERVCFELRTGSQQTEINVRGMDPTAAKNALAAAAIALAADIDLSRIASGLANYRPPDGRMTSYRVPPGITIIDDSYNCNPESLAAALDALARLARDGRSLAVLGDMNELGEHAADEHRAAGRRVQQVGVDLLFAVGRHAKEMAQGAQQAGMPKARIVLAQEMEELIGTLQDRMAAGDWILVKGSREARMERVVDTLVKEENR